MKRACIYVNPFFVKDGVFSQDDPFLNRDNQLEPFRQLRAAFQARGYSLRTQDFHSPESSELTVYFDMPDRLPSKELLDRSYLVIFETELIRPDNWKVRKHRHFKKVFTWSESHLRDDRSNRYVKINFPQVVPSQLPDVPFKDRPKLCCLIAGGKLSIHRRQLYSERIRWIRWFEKNHPEDFAFYGAGWKRLWVTGPLWVRAVNKLPFWRKILYPPFPSYLGPVDKKLETLSKTKFSICLENGRDIEGYITEKIFDCFFAGNVPLYRGAQDIADHVPENCFIDLRQFKTREEIYEKIKTMSEAEFEGYRQRISAFLKSEKFAPFSIATFVKTIVDQCVK